MAFVDEQRDLLPHLGTALGYVLLSVPTVLLFGLGVAGALIEGRDVLIGVTLIGVTVGVAVGIRSELWLLKGPSETAAGGGLENLRITGAILGGTVLTLLGVVELGLSPIVSAGIVGVGSTVLTSRRAVPAYCGAFVGMTSPILFTAYWHAIVAGLVASVVFLLAQSVFLGVGGKLGTTAFVGTVLTVLGTGSSFGSMPLPDVTILLLVMGYAIVGAVVTFATHTRFSPSPVFASGAVGAVGGLVLPIVHDGTGALLAAAVFSASFAGMTDPKRIPDERWIGLSGLLVGLVVVYTSPYLAGSGGKLGTIAFGSCLAVHGLLRTVDVVRLQRRARELPGRDTT